MVTKAFGGLKNLPTNLTGTLDFGVKMGFAVLGHPCFWAKIKGGGFKNVKKLKKKRQKVKKRCTF